MLNSAISILNFDDSLLRQKELLLKYQPKIINCLDLAPAARLWMNKATKEEISKRISARDKDGITFIGSGDFHHITSILLEQFKEPLSLVVFDLHPDWDTLPPRLGCGSWVSSVLRNKNILKVILIGISSCDISTFNIQSGNLAALKDDRLEIYPYEHAPAKVFLKRVPQNISLDSQNKIYCTRIKWVELKKRDLSTFMISLVQRLPTKRTYVSLDKDCLKNKYALTNWEEGKISLDELFLMLKPLKDNSDIAGFDITGEYSPIAIKNKWKAFFSRLDHPKVIKAETFPQDVADRINQETNLKILELFSDAHI